MIRPALAGALLVATLAGGLPAPAQACTITAKRYPIDGAVRCRQHQDRIHRAGAVAEVEVGDFDLTDDLARPEVSTGRAPIRVIRVLSGELKRTDYSYQIVVELPDGVECGFSNSPNRGRQIAFFQADGPDLDTDELQLESSQAYETEASFCRPV